MNAICERLIGTLRREVLDRTLILNQAHLRAVLAEYQEHYNTARPSRASASASRTLASIPAPPQPTPARGRSTEKPVLSCLINEYERAPDI
jgi:putative transposase